MPWSEESEIQACAVIYKRKDVVGLMCGDDRIIHVVGWVGWGFDFRKGNGDMYFVEGFYCT